MRVSGYRLQATGLVLLLVPVLVFLLVLVLDRHATARSLNAVHLAAGNWLAVRRRVAKSTFPHPPRIGGKPRAFSRREKAAPCSERSVG